MTEENESEKKKLRAIIITVTDKQFEINNKTKRKKLYTKKGEGEQIRYK